MTTSAEVRTRLVRELRLDLIGPRNDDPGLANEILPEPPSRWYLTGFLLPIGASERLRIRRRKWTRRKKAAPTTTPRPSARRIARAGCPRRWG